MHSSLTAVVLCIFAHAASAQCVVDAPLAGNARMGAEVIRTSTSPAPAARQGGELIKTAAAGTRDTPRAAGASPVVARGDGVQGDEEHPRRSGTAMLLAALALMSGIALRRYGANPQ